MLCIYHFQLCTMLPPMEVLQVSITCLTGPPFVFISLGTNNARLAAMLRQLAQYHAKDPNNLFMVRLAQVSGNTKNTLRQSLVN